jgi:twitching motility protein PilT
MSEFNLEQILGYAVKNQASDVHLTVNSPPAVRIDGVIRFIGEKTLRPNHTEAFCREILGENRWDDFDQKGDADLSLGISGLGRFRVNCLRQRGSYAVVLRHVKGKILDFDSLNLPDTMETIANLRRGLVLVTGTTGSGKSTTLASVIDRINEERHQHIVTLEDPIEFLHSNKNSIITQREIGLDTNDFHTALRAVMREDPDVILIGEMRDAETFQAAISAAETGHLVFSTLHTTNAMMTIDRIQDLFPSNQQEQIRSQLSLQLRGCVAQRLLIASDGKGRIPAVEVMFNTPAIAALIRENTLKQIPNAIAAGREEGMQSFNHSLVDLVRRRLVTEEEARWASDNPEELKMNLQGIFLSSGRGGILKR